MLLGCTNPEIVRFRELQQDGSRIGCDDQRNRAILTLGHSNSTFSSIVADQPKLSTRRSFSDRHPQFVDAQLVVSQSLSIIVQIRPIRTIVGSLYRVLKTNVRSS